MKSEEEVKTRFACIGTVAFARKVNVIMFILMKTVIFICRGRHAGIANVETYRDRQGQTRTSRQKLGHTGTSRDKHGNTKGLSLLVPVCSCLSLPCPCLSLPVPALSLALTGIIGK